MYICIYIYIYIHVCIYVLLPLLDLLSFTAGNEAPLSVGKAAQHIVHHHEQFSTTGRDCSSLVGLYLSLLPYLLLPKEICPLSKGKGPVADILIRWSLRFAVCVFSQAGWHWCHMGLLCPSQLQLLCAAVQSSGGEDQADQQKLAAGAVPALSA